MSGLEGVKWMSLQDLVYLFPACDVGIVVPQRQPEYIGTVASKLAWSYRCSADVELLLLNCIPLSEREDYDGNILAWIFGRPGRMPDEDLRPVLTRHLAVCPVRIPRPRLVNDGVPFPCRWQRNVETILSVPILSLVECDDHDQNNCGYDYNA